MRSKAFTLIELLIVIAIIGILMALLFPAVGSAITAARKAQARNDAVQIATACRAYETEYGVGPWGTNSFTEVRGALLDALMGTNARRIIFIEVPYYKSGKGGYTNGAFLDPWGGPYQIAYDTNYSSDIQNAGTNGKAKVRSMYAVWTDPSKQDPKKTNNIPPDRRYVESW
ncbi:prepilin-type N-terminal cleavage/methylation domain-containing protein [Terrimicrobium sacchariphilum]|jgi:prepilin-type N-terminal cleavage/methylation domain-containing protein|uniref:Prepilin-type N-terminal cleavage/methylation domain-containing protein n=1 Tax=Terrimicrobium sacchariphilum TaxID=690879 RepID=A0A146G226_TERSA|nr:prepilin-type N-terminal cleavage/methylation domain-containing protein [Terrimicrobium sacchariphilum]GAT31562.1 prepilin-type N-terminal cleavage/methylation domain-containing protein [Terrimicrobium sacchariphilum]